MEEIKGSPTREEIVEYFKENGLVECNLNYVAFATLREALEELVIQFPNQKKMQIVVLLK